MVVPEKCFFSAISNKNMPRTFGDTLIHESHIDFMIENDFPLHERKFGAKTSEAEKKIGELIANELVANGATLQMGMLFFLNSPKISSPLSH